MYRTKSVGPRMEPSGTCEDSPSKTTRSNMLLRKDAIRPNTRPEIHSTGICDKAQYKKDLDVSSTTALVAPDLLKALATLSDTAFRRSAVYREDL